MPKLLQCAHCRKHILGGTYTLIKHFQQCIKTSSPETTAKLTKIETTKPSAKEDSGLDYGEKPVKLLFIGRKYL